MIDEVDTTTDEAAQAVIEEQIAAVELLKAEQEGIEALALEEVARLTEASTNAMNVARLAAEIASGKKIADENIASIQVKIDALRTKISTRRESLVSQAAAIEKYRYNANQETGDKREDAFAILDLALAAEDADNRQQISDANLIE